jgi:2-polyprenyl-3-methyl-5-hydroxy-6-metoxy-1,4-benzoquinol methylase
MEEGTLIIDAYKQAAASTDVPIWNYKGLEIHAFPATHEGVVDAANKYVDRGAKALDVGSGSGALCLRLHDGGFSVVGCDVVHENFKLHDKIPFIQCNLNQNFADVFTERFAAIAATEIIEHIENPRHFLRQCF